MENINFRGIPTSLFLNGPKIEIVTDPQNENSVIGVATFTGIATAIFIDSNFDFDSDGGGSIAFKWYFDGSLISDYCDDVTSNAKIVGFDDATGTGSTITISGLTADDYGKSVYFEADYIPSAYSLPTGSQVRAGSARSTGNAFNEPVKSLTARVFPLPLLEVVSNPKDQISVSDAEFSVVGEINPDTIDKTINYQWQLDEVDIVDGSNIQTTVSQLQPGTFTITGDDGSSQTVIASESTVIDNFKEGVTYTLSTDTDTVAKIFAKGAGGGASGGRSISGGKGGFASGTFKFIKNQEYKVRIGGAGQDGAGGGAGGFSGGGTGGGGFGKGGGGGGFTGLFIDSITFDNVLIIAGGGGGGSNAAATGGDGGGLIAPGASNESGYFGDGGGGGGGTQFDGGSSDIANGSGSALQGGTGAAGGGGGYYGGGGGNPSLACAEDGAGGGGSSYIGGKDEAQGQAAFTTPGTYTWTAPSGVTSVSVVCVGGGGGGSGDDDATGGYGGGLGWKNNIPVIPGQGYLVVVGSGGKGNSSGDGEFGDPSYFINLSTVGGLGGPGGSPSGMSTTGGDFVGDGGGLGGGTESINIYAAAGGGAGGYSGNGGFARNNNSGTDGEGGGGGAGQDGGFDKDDRGGGGGGVGILGQGENGKGGGNEGENIGDPGEGGSGGTIGVKGTLGGHGGSFGGGGGQLTQGKPGNGGDGAVRIIWGSDREFPSTNTEDLNSIDTVSVINGETTTGGGSAAGADGSLSIVVRGTEIESLTQTANLSFSGATSPNLTISSSGGDPPILVGTSIVESDNGVVTNATKTKFVPGTKGGPQTEFPKNSTKNELGGFTTPDKSSLLFMGSYSSTLEKNRSATWNNVKATNVTEIRLLAIRGNDHNGGERPNDNGEDLSIELTTLQSKRTKTIISEGTGDNSSDCAWNEYVIPLNEAEKVSNLQISIKSKAGSKTEFSSVVQAQFSENIGKVYKNANDAYGVNWIRLYNGDTLVQDLTFNTSSEISGAVRCKLSTNDVVTSPVFSDHASYIATPPTNILKIEEYRYNDEIAILHDFILDETRESEVVCISVIDEDSSYDVDTRNKDYNRFRKNWPKRPFWLLRPKGQNTPLDLPKGWEDDPLAYGPITVFRDPSVSDWFSITGLNKAPEGTVVSLLIDESGSMKGDVTSSESLFVKKCRRNGIIINDNTANPDGLDNDKMDPTEHWIGQHDKEFINDLNNALIVDYEKYPGNAVCLYARDQDINVQMELHGGKGANKGSNSGGTGGYSKTTLTMKKGEEYVITGLFDAVNTPFVYRKGTLIAVVGQGGDAGVSSKGGNGGAIDVSGRDGSGSSGGEGGVKIQTGDLPSSGIFGSRTTLTPVTQDSKATGVDGGRTIPCPRGDYWRDQGKTPCEDLGEIKFRTPNGTELSNTAKIERGYKSGYDIIQTKGKGETDDSGDGGSGATGGNGGVNGRAGGGGSGYTDGSITVVDTSAGGSRFSVAKVVIRLL